jgi:hypothetical protein
MHTRLWKFCHYAVKGPSPTEVWQLLLYGRRAPAIQSEVVVVVSVDSFCGRCGTRLVIGNRHCTGWQGNLTGDGVVAERKKL